MSKRISKSQPNSPLQLLELLGKPVLFLITIIGILFLSLLHLLTIFPQSLLRYFHSLQLPKLPKFTLPHFTLPKIHLPKLSSSYLKIVIFLILIPYLLFTMYYVLIRDLPNPHLLSTSLPSLSTKIYDRNHTLLYQIYRDENRTLIHLDDLPQHLIEATLASEDQSFYSHFGISLSGIARAFYSNLTCTLHLSPCTTLQGGSTITQQLVKNAFLTPERTWKRKLKELILALWTESIYTKEEILEFYFNYVPYGGTAYGIEEASHYYFDKSAQDLSLSESTLLAGLPVAPTTLSPFGVNPYLAKHRQHQVLDRMLEEQIITEQDAKQAKDTTLAFRNRGNGILAPHFVMYIQELLVQKFGEDMVHRGGLEVTTTLDLSLQKLLESNIQSELANINRLNVTNGAGLILSPSTGEILAMVGSVDFFDTEHDGQVNVTLSERQPGSSIKPLTYALALNSGLTPASKIDDSPICFSNPGQPPYCPKNYDNRFHGQVTLRQALANSYNIPAIKLLNNIGVDNLVQLGKNLGITTWTDSSRFGLALTLGGGEVTMLELANAYASFARSGDYIPTKSIISVTNHATIPTTPTPTPKNIISPTIAYQISSILSDNSARSQAFGYHSVLNIPGHQVAVKTGTSNDLKDNWTFGYTTDYLVATWVGNNDNSPMSSVASGITGASPIWSHTMQELLRDTPPHTFAPPTNLIRVNLSCQETPHYEYFVPGTEPHINCNLEPKGEIL